MKKEITAIEMPFIARHTMTAAEKAAARDIIPADMTPAALFALFINVMPGNSPVKLTIHDDSHKMAGFKSVSTSVKLNAVCRARVDAIKKALEKGLIIEKREKETRISAKTGKPYTAYKVIYIDAKTGEPIDFICPHCYADALTGFRKGVRDNVAHNTRVLAGRLLTLYEILCILADIGYYARAVRFEAWGDANNTIQAVNYLNIARVAAYIGMKTVFGLWTKNPNYYKQAIEILNGRPLNIVYILSSYRVNVPDDDIAARFGFFDYIFTTYDAAHFDAADGVYCKGVRCANCMNCYTVPAARGAAAHIKELKR